MPRHTEGHAVVNTIFHSRRRRWAAPGSTDDEHPGLVPILVLSQVLNVVLLLPLSVFMYGISRDRDLMGPGHRSGMNGAFTLSADC
jgi:hypothetical protein